MMETLNALITKWREPTTGVWGEPEYYNGMATLRALAIDERVAQLIAHRACHAAEHDPLHGRIHGYCIVCGIPWSCGYAGKPPAHASLVQEMEKKIKALPRWEAWDEAPVPMHEHKDGEWLLRDDVLEVLALLRRSTEQK